MRTSPSPDCFVVVVSGVPGSGKSTLVGSVVEALGGALTLHFDDYGGLPSTRKTSRRGCNPEGEMLQQDVVVISVAAEGERR